MSLLVVGSIALDSIETPFGTRDDALGGSAVFFAAAASHLHAVKVVGVMGDDYPIHELEPLKTRDVDLSEVEHAAGESFRWKGKYSYDLQNRDTLDTRLGVFADFAPLIPDRYRDAKYVFLGNIDPVLQLQVLDQIDDPDLVACDTMNFWIEGKRDELIELLGRIDLLMVNDAEARELSGDWNIHRAAKWILDHGPSMVVIKQGEYGAVLVDKDSTFYVPAFPLEEVYDPTGAGDSFAGGFMGHLARSGDVTHANMRTAMVYGATTGSFAVEEFSIDRLNRITADDIEKRAREFSDLVHFEIEVLK